MILLRHADRQPAPLDDLTPAGRQRARDLARLLSRSGATYAVHSGYVRAQKTLEPLKETLGSALRVERIAGVEETVDALTAQPDDVVAVVVGHSDTVGPIAEGLGSAPLEAIAAIDFDRLFILSRDGAGCVSLLQLRYGAGS